MKHNLALYPEHLHARLERYPALACEVCNEVIVVARRTGRENRQLVTPSRYAMRRYCSPACHKQGQIDYWATRKRKAAAPRKPKEVAPPAVPTVPEFVPPGVIEPVPVATPVQPPEMTRKQYLALVAAVGEHPSLAGILRKIRERGQMLDVDHTEQEPIGGR